MSSRAPMASSAHRRPRPRPVARFVAVAAVVSWMVPVAAADDITAADQMAVVQRIAPSIVTVEYHLRYDDGVPPEGLLGQYQCPNCGDYHYYDSGEELIQQERPLAMSGFVVGPQRVIAQDTKLQERFVERIRVRQGDHVVDATIDAFGMAQDGVILELDAPLPGAAVLAFEAARVGPYLTVACTEGNGTWTTAVQPLAANVSLRGAMEPFVAVPPSVVIVDRHGGPVGLAMTPELPASDAWKGTPLAWPTVAAPQRRARHEALRRRVDQGLLRVALHFRSPKQQETETEFMIDHYDEGLEEASATERDGVGILVDDVHLIVLENLSPKTTARLDRIRVMDAAGRVHPARFVATLRDYGALVIALEEPTEGAIAFSSAPPEDHRYRYLDLVDLRIAGEQRILFFGHDRISGFERGWRQHIYPITDVSDEGFLFDASGQLVALPIAPRTKVAMRNQWMSDEVRMTAVGQIQGVLDDLAAHADDHNVPLSEEEESRLAWMGVELQGLDRELARANAVAELTQDGETGALVTFVHPGSPAAGAGVEPGMILLRLHVDDQPKPIDVAVEMDHGFGGAFPWDQYDQVTEEYFEHIPRPWNPVENHFTRTLTDLGFGTDYRAEFVQDGQRIDKAFVVAQSPPHFDSAPKYTSEALGITVRDLTYEVRHNLQMAAHAPGVIISKVEPGSPAAVAGIKPYETITHIGGDQVQDVKQFEAGINDTAELRLTVRRMSQVRQVRIRVE